MKKPLHTLCAFCTLFTCSCETNNVSKARVGVKAIGKCCEELSPKNTKSDAIKEGQTTKQNDNVSAILPTYFWDTKCMIW